MILIYKNIEGRSIVYDLDSRLEFPCSFSVYANEVIRDDSTLKQHLRRFVQCTLVSQYYTSFLLILELQN